MVIIFFSFGYQKWWAYEAQRLIPYISHGPLISLAISGFWRPRSQLRSQLVFGFLRMVVRHAAVAGLLEQKAGYFGRARLMPYVCWHRHDHPIYAGRVGCLGWPRFPGHSPATSPFLMLRMSCSLAVSVYLLKQDVQRVVLGSVIRE